MRASTNITAFIPDCRQRPVPYRYRTCAAVTPSRNPAGGCSLNGRGRSSGLSRLHAFPVSGERPTQTSFFEAIPVAENVKLSDAPDFRLASRAYSSGYCRGFSPRSLFVPRAAFVRPGTFAGPNIRRSRMQCKFIVQKSRRDRDWKERNPPNRGCRGLDRFSLSKKDV